MRTKEQWGQFICELENIKQDLEAFLEISRDEMLNFCSLRWFPECTVNQFG